jgi:phospholipid/cholesterol/gamma-HCH transport system substrate-binding protein
MSFGRQLRRYAPAMIAITLMGALALGVAAYILAHQRLRFPWQESYTVRIELASAQAISPGQGQTVVVAGVAVGAITRVELHQGLAVVEAEIDPDKLPRVYANATALVRPKTGLQDMVVALDPGTPRARALRDGDVIPVAHTRPQVSLDQVLAGLDADTRDYLRTLIAEGARGLDGRGEQLRAVLKAGAPTLRMTRRVTAAIADRRTKVRRLIRNLRLLGEATAGRDVQLAELVGSSAAAFAAIDSRQAALRDGLAELPAAVSVARTALAAARPFSDELGRTLTELLPTARGLDPALRSAGPLVREATPALKDVLALVRAARPVAADLAPITADLETATPDLTATFGVLRHLTNELAYNPPGSEEGYLFWTAWFAHNAASLLSGRDAHGVFWRGQAIFSCSSLATFAAAGSGAQNPIAALAPLLPCPAAPAGSSG